MKIRPFINKLKYLHPFLFALAPAIFLWEQNFEEVSTLEGIQAVVALTVFAGIVLAISYFIYRNIEKATILSSTVLLLFLSYRYIFFNPLTSEFMRHWYAFVISFVTIAFLGYVLYQTRKNMTVHAEILTAISGTFVLISLFGFSVNMWEKYTYTVPPIHTELAAILSAGERAETEALRDIYYIILDAHLAPDIIKKAMNDDEIDDITDWLSEQGFFVASASKSNYSNTLDSLSSSLNMRYLTDEELERADMRVDIMLDSLVGNFLKRQGYYYINLGASWVDHYNPNADENIYFGSFTPYQMLLIYTSILGFPERDREGLAGKLSKTLQLFKLNQRFLKWQRVQFKFDELAKIPEREEPVFVFAHFILPHPPYVFDAEGNYITEKESNAQTIGKRYVGDVEFASKQIKKMIENILANSEPEPIIIIQADHGWKAFAPETLTQSTLSEEERIELPVRILNTYYFPDGGDKALYNSISPVNSFRVLLNYYFDQDHELLDDISYFTIPDDSNPHKNKSIIY